MFDFHKLGQMLTILANKIRIDSLIVTIFFLLFTFWDMTFKSYSKTIMLSGIFWHSDKNNLLHEF